MGSRKSVEVMDRQNSATDSDLADTTIDIGEDDSGSDFDSLFDERGEGDLSTSVVLDSLSEHVPIAQRDLSLASNGIQILGIFFDPSILIPAHLEKSTWEEAWRRYFADGTTNQIMLFERAVALDSEGGASSKLPQFLVDLLNAVSALLRPLIPTEIHDLLFVGPLTGSRAQPFPLDEEVSANAIGGANNAVSGRMMCARQAILNHYLPGEGISPHVDLLGRYADGIVGVSLGCGTVMDFERVKSFTTQPTTSSSQDGADGGVHLYLPARSIIMMTGEARYEWSHGIAKRIFDVVEDEDGHLSEVERGERISITFRWLLPGADVVGA